MKIDPALLRYEQVEPGLVIETGGITVTEAHIIAFAGLTGDFFDIHMDDDYARSLGYPGRVAHGLLGLALGDGLKNRAPTRFAAIVSLSWRWSFTGPILVGDRIAARITVLSKRLTKNPARGILTMGFDLTNQRGEVVQKGENDMMVHTLHIDEGA
ncbi:MaoC/PaaZ C-terminal domain-containing protein [Falsiroseomonas sp.]|uniref:MaoC family dehydratase n=1 Tax=Falsiroseomonas sp. TaxID=2870721 RepID=UPI00271B3A8B|nr:MaoC/PaaZ C-terminal domain-containing protein [Falsiroseomonas sp.]MDO9498875.1 MaoC/PaaZ C-terminal domain-containing protein [Falsiroseomonas sp.]